MINPLHLGIIKLDPFYYYLFQILGDTVLCFEEEGHFQLELDWVDALFSVFE